MSAWRFALVLGAAAVYVTISVLIATLCDGVDIVGRLYVLQHVGVHLALGFGFALSLRGPGLSMIGRIARQVHRDFTPAMAAYTYKVTAAWVVYFFGMAALSLAVYARAPWAAWSLLSNVVTPAAIVALFIGEHLLRYRLHPEFERVTLRDAVCAYRRSRVFGR
jgi:uncharacterized membrane protein